MSDPLPIGIAVTELRPTQMTVGFREVEIKRRQWREADEEARAKLLRRHVVPAVVRPKGRYFIVDHHHFAKALLDEKALLIAINIVADLQHLAKDEFWAFLDNSDWCHVTMPPALAVSYRIFQRAYLNLRTILSGAL